MNFSNYLIGFVFSVNYNVVKKCDQSYPNLLNIAVRSASFMSKCASALVGVPRVVEGNVSFPTIAQVP